MQQRRFRPGDILDDYCPRERRVTNHAVVAMVDDEVKQTRCATCDAEHDFKHGKMPTLRRKKDAVSTAYQEVLAAVTSDPVAMVAPVPAAPRQELSPTQPPSPPAPAPQAVAAESAPEPPRGQAPAPPAPPADLAPVPGDETEAARVHRRLIRATLPRSENQPVVRPIPEFTMHLPQGRPAKFRGGAGRSAGPRPGGGRGGYGSPASRGPVFGRPAGNRSGAGRNEGARHSRGPHPGSHGKKHSK